MKPDASRIENYNRQSVALSDPYARGRPAGIPTPDISQRYGTRELNDAAEEVAAKALQLVGFPIR